MYCELEKEFLGIWKEELPNDCCATLVKVSSELEEGFAADAGFVMVFMLLFERGLSRREFDLE